MGERGYSYRLNKKGQLTLFIILAIVIIIGILIYFLINKPISQEVPVQFRPVYNYYLSCLEEITKQGLALLGEQAGYIEKPVFVPGSQYMPFSSQMEFMGQGVPYWLYVSGNNILKEQVPKKSEMESQLANYIAERVNYCDLSSFNLQGYDVIVEENPKVQVAILEGYVDVIIENDLSMYFGNDSAFLKSQNLRLNSKLGKFYELALRVYNYEKKNVFLEEYALDVLRLYAPVDGSEISCKPKFFDDTAIKQNLSIALMDNIASLKLRGDYYTSNEDQKYFITDIGQSIDESVNFIYSPNMPTKIEIYGDRVVQPVGLQEGLGILGFCYVPYHLVYDIRFPVLIQFFDEDELFQFPLAVIIERNSAREGLEGEAGFEIKSDLCNYLTQDFSVYTYDSELNPVEASLRFKCINTECAVGESKLTNGDSFFKGKLPQCVNGFISATAEGYAPSKVMVSTNEETSANVILSKLYNLNLNLGSEINYAIVNFDSEDYSTTVAYPDIKQVELIEGLYNITIYAYTNSSITLQEKTETKCVDVLKSNILGIFGGTNEKCFDLIIPSQKIDYAIIGGGKTQEYITENQLRTGENVNIQVQLFRTPRDIQELQENYIELETAKLYLEIV